ncbi:MAG: hypothetical protein QGI10_01155 [Vicinamibacterales bacterium]|nr:hypothetical protein [Vicinamibacterales bacterium]HJN46350.1 hypothetical protein [Vicinamibacterales bacterium]
MPDTTTERSGDGPDVSRNPRYIFILAIVSGLILSVGWLVRPSESISEPLSAPSQVELSRLPSLRQRGPLEEMAEFFAGVATDLAPAVVRLPSVGRSGVVWSAERVVTARLAWRFPTVVTVAVPNGDVGAFAPQVSTVVLAAVVIYETVGPVSTRFALVRSGEAGMDHPASDAVFEM